LMQINDITQATIGAASRSRTNFVASAADGTERWFTDQFP
jgi:hypothetical protein